MAESVVAGEKIRERRRALGLKQGTLAEKAGLSASYINLLELGRRRIGTALAHRLAAALDTDLAALTQTPDATVLEALQFLAPSPDMAGTAEKFAETYPAWAAQLAASHARVTELEARLEALNDGLTHDTVLADNMNEVLGAAAAIRSTASILVATPDLAADWRTRFFANIDSESRRLADSSGAMAARFDGLLQRRAGPLTAKDALREFLIKNRYHLEGLEQGKAPNDLLSETAAFDDPLHRETARGYFDTYARDARDLPLATFAAAAKTLAYDPAGLAQKFDAPLAKVFRRLASLPPGPDRPEIGLITCDAAGAILFEKIPRGFRMPKTEAGCARWPLFEALTGPGLPIHRRVMTSDGQSFDAYAIRDQTGPPQFDALPVLRASMLLIARAETSEPAFEIGPGCAFCPVKGCSARREASVLA